MRIRVVNYVSDKRVEIYSLAEKKTLIAVFNTPSVMKVKNSVLGQNSGKKKYTEYFIYNERIKVEEPNDYTYQEVAYINNLMNEVEYKEIRSERIK